MNHYKLFEIITQPTYVYEKFWSIFDYLMHFYLWQKPAGFNRFSENYLPGSYFELSPSHVNHNIIPNFICDKSQPDWTNSQRTITQAHILEYLPDMWIT